MSVLINNDISERVLDMGEAIDVLEDAWEQHGVNDAAFLPRTDMGSPRTTDLGDEYDYDEYWFACLQGLTVHPPRFALRFRSDVHAYKIWEDQRVTEERYNVEPGKFMGFILLFDASDGELLALMNDGVIQHARVAAQAGLAAKYLSREDSETLGMLGSGGMARSYAEAMNEVRDISEINVFSPTEANREEYAREVSEKMDIPVTAMESPADAVSNADIVSMCTTAGKPIFDPDWLEKGQFLVDTRSPEVGTETIEEIDKVVVTDKRSYISSHEMYAGSSEEYAKRMEYLGTGSGLPSHSNTPYDYPTLTDLVTGEDTGREDDDEITFYFNRSAGIQFASVGNLVYEKAVDRDLGTEVPLAWFQELVKN